MALPLRYSLGHLWQRRLRTGFTVGVVAGVVLATSLFTGLVSSLRRTVASTGRPDNLIVLRKGATNDGSSLVSLEAYQNIRHLPGIARSSDGRPLVSPELVVQPFFRTSDGGRENVLVRGVTPVALEVHDRVKIAAGRMFQTSHGEAIVGRRVAGRYVGDTLGSELHFGRSVWKVVGLFESGGSSFESEVWVDVRELANDTRRTPPFSGLRVRAAPGADLEALARRIGADPRYALEASPEVDYYAKQAESAKTFYGIALGLAVLAGVGAAFGAANTMYASVQARTREIGTLRALGFSRRSILAAVLLESLAIGAIGFALGGALAMLAAVLITHALGGVAFGAATFSTNVVALRVGAFDLAVGALLATAIALAGGLFPAARAARLKPAEALRHA